jgi:RNA polymerase sigma-70 factor (ECF subfamily)
MDAADDFAGVLAAARHGQEWAVAALYRDAHPRLARFLGAREPRAADDIEGDVWLAVAKGIERFEGDEHAFRAWVFAIARRRLADHRRCAARRATEPVPNDRLEYPDVDDTETIALGALSVEEAAAYVEAVLPPDQAEIVLLRVLGGLDTEEVAHLLDKRPGTVRVLQHRALRKLAELLRPAPVTQ